MDAEEKRLRWQERMAHQLMTTGTFCPICAGTGASSEPLKGQAGCRKRCRHCGGKGRKWGTCAECGKEITKYPEHEDYCNECFRKP